mmetsp:Transcript_33139/g.70635  ORF Transcript_33139/g.70635 Transcript_33139/m.70635 type:complete len:91 (+) Transcript_33139:100-372(+)
MLKLGSSYTVDKNSGRTKVSILIINDGHVQHDCRANRHPSGHEAPVHRFLTMTESRLLRSPPPQDPKELWKCGCLADEKEVAEGDDTILR